MIVSMPGAPTLVSGDGEGTTSRRLPDVLLIIIVFGDYNHLLSDKIGRVKTDAKLTNHGNVSTSLE